MSFPLKDHRAYREYLSQKGRLSNATANLSHLQHHAIVRMRHEEYEAIATEIYELARKLGKREEEKQRANNEAEV